MWKWLEKIRNKSDHEKKTFAFGISAIFTAIIFIVWASSFYVSISSGFGKDTLPDVATPVSAIKESFSKFFQYDKESFENIKTEIDDLAKTASSTVVSTTTLGDI